jgi:hypothetical protein
MFRGRRGAVPLVVAMACLAIVMEAPGIAPGQQEAGSRKARARRTPQRKSAAKAQRRPEAGGDEKSVADRVVLRDKKELLGQVDDSIPGTALTFIARRELVRATLPDRAQGWEDAERQATAAALRQRREWLAGWRHERPPGPAPGDRITAWLDRELSAPAGSVASWPLIALHLRRDDVSAVERRGDAAARALRQAWLLGLPDPETTSPARLTDAIAGRGRAPDGDDPIAIDRLLPPALETADRWLLRRAATEVLHDEGLRFIRFGNTVLPEPLPGQPIDPSAGVALVEGTIRDVLGVGVGDSLPSRLRDAADRGRVGVMVTSIAIGPDLGSVSAESTLYYRRGGDWWRGIWRSEGLKVGSVPPLVVSIVAGDPQVKAVMDLIDAVGAGFVSPAMKERGLVVGTTVGGAVALARTALVRSLMGIGFDVEGKGPDRSPRTRP